MAQQAFDPNGIGQGDNFFGLPESKDSAIVIIPVPWEVTVSYGSGAAKGPDLVREESLQVDLYDPDWGADFWRVGIVGSKGPERACRAGKSLRPKVVRYIAALQQGKKLTKEHQKVCAEVLKAGRRLQADLKAEVLAAYKARKKVVVLGGDHSTPLGAYEALSEIAPGFGILHLDAHMDLRRAYEGFEQSHASIMYNALQLPGVSKIVQVGIRDYCDAEMQLHRENPERLKLFTDRSLHFALDRGETWHALVHKIVATLPQQVYLSFDIDALNPSLCPNTGTPVPGGLEFHHVVALLLEIRDSGRQLIGADLVEVAGSPWDGNVGARALFQICALMAHSCK